MKTNVLIYVLALVVINMISGCKTSKPTASIAPMDDKQRAEREALHMQRETQLKKREEELKKIDTEIATRTAASKEAHIGKLSRYFDSIVGSENLTLADKRVNEALRMFATTNVPVLIVINEEDGRKDYGQPTTIRNYLNLLKEQKKNINLISDLKLDYSGKITSVELCKN